MTAPQPGVLFTGSYLTGNYNPGVPGGPSVFDTLAFPPASGVASQTAGLDEQAALGVVDPPQAVLDARQKNTDPMKNFYDGAGIQGVDNDNVP